MDTLICAEAAGDPRKGTNATLRADAPAASLTRPAVQPWDRLDTFLSTYCFRLRFELPEGVRLPFGEKSIVLDPAGVDMIAVLPDGSLSSATRVVVKGRGYTTEPAAMEAGRWWADVLRRAFATLSVGADFGDWAPQSGFSRGFLDSVHDTTGVRHLNDVHGLMTYEEDPPPVFASVGGMSLVVSSAEDRVRLAVDLAARSGQLTEAERLAYDIFSASFVVAHRPDARLMVLMMALETLLVPQVRSPEAVALVDAFIQTVQDSTNITASERDSLVGSASWMRKESIGGAGRRLVATLGARTYGGMPAVTFFTRCYLARSQLAHGAIPRPERHEVGVLAASLQDMVGHLIAGADLVDAVNPPPAPSP